MESVVAACRFHSCVVAMAIAGCSGDDTETRSVSNAGAAGIDASAPHGSSGGRAGDSSSGGRAGSNAAGGAGAADSGTATGGSGAASGHGGAADSGSDAGSGSPGGSLGSFVLTYYWVTAEDDFSGAKDVTLYDDSCAAIAVVSGDFAASLGVEGTGRLSDGRVLNVSGACACPTSPCYMGVDAQHPWGYGARSNALVPFRSIAVDRNVIALGTHVYIAELDGVTMPGDPSYGGFVHDGCVSADDVGGGVNGKHVDFFAALEAHYRALDGALGLNSVSVYEGGSRCP